ncbi:MAG: hypothetical protein Q4C98_09270 [Capnocytophaga sp.]|nr:hypothetical protein [Capnocytophaga sp.]
MCYIITISTDKPDDLAVHNFDGIYFEKVDKPLFKSVLAYPNMYEIATMAQGSCSCHLRIFDEPLSKEMGFCELQDWLGESDDDDDILRTRSLFEFIKELVNQGFKVDSFVSWNDDSPSEIGEYHTKKVPVNTLPKEQFAFFEHWYFEYIMD